MKKKTRMRLALRHFLTRGRYLIDGHVFVAPRNTPDAARLALYWSEYEKPERELARKWLPVGQPVIELGGSYGIVSYVIRQRIGMQTPMVIVEANPELLSVCKRNARIRRGENVELLNSAVSHTDRDTVEFAVTPGIHTSHVVEAGANSEDQVIRVPAVSLSQLAGRFKAGNAYSLVCDIEGGELEIFERDAEALKWCSCAIVEYHPDVFSSRGRTVEEFFDLVRAAGLEIVDQSRNVIVAIRSSAASYQAA